VVAVSLQIHSITVLGKTVCHRLRTSRLSKNLTLPIDELIQKQLKKTKNSWEASVGGKLDY
jgi:hypothetical protein